MALGVRARGFVGLTRPGNAIAAGVLTFTGAFVAGATFGDTLAVVAAVLATVFATGAGNAINDYFDREIDRINRPDRPIPSGAVTASEAKWFSVALFGGAVVSALALPLVAIAIAVVNLVALLAYTEFFKGLPGVGNVVVAALTGSTFLFGGAAIGEPLGALVLCVLAALATLTREIVKDVEDIAGDREEGLRTLPIVVGERPSLWLGVAVLVVAVAASAVPFVSGEFGLVYLGLVVPADGVMLVASAQSFENPGTAQRRLKQGMFLAAFAFIVGRATSLTIAF
ncbi:MULTISPECIES: geranylgeranylglycerol-phosphate geranylgeranyltransferase [Haloferax]|uniref:Digeranylgeranylglyceryl phosphate synthase n=1 Tax=Haloferax marinum TaxID=2666143 RepID=A0A6A8G449_9EURY|nr:MULTISPECIES: geranylgeranylglycerol-phosphate geranylgeranyltransferase [Haloferax]KAB1196346.1 geranylgeranylglycerol-phosphate geranylgeranyltransferase [Haloferax sp. CBA1150]MRW95338.1 geranylgeranylglycerol-phosphate geranylgeranyltransferase [Haloferax marinum]